MEGHRTLQEISLFYLLPMWECGLKNLDYKAGETNQRLRTLIPLAQDLDSVPSTRVVTHNYPKIQFRGLWISFWPLEALKMHTAHTFRQNTHIHRNKINLFVNNYEEADEYYVNSCKCGRRWGLFMMMRKDGVQAKGHKSPEGGYKASWFSSFDSDMASFSCSG